VSNRASGTFECHWQASRSLLLLYLLALALAFIALIALPVPTWLRLSGMLMCLFHAAWTIPSGILLSSARAWSGLRHEHNGWSLCCRQGEWQPVQLRPDSIALPWLVLLRFRLPGERFSRSLCIAADSLPADQHRRLRVRLKFSRRRWAAPE